MSCMGMSKQFNKKILCEKIQKLIIIYIYDAYIFYNSICHSELIFRKWNRFTCKKKYFNEINFSWTNYISLIILAPIVEELFYRYGLKFSVKKATFLAIGIVYTIYLFFQPKNTNFEDPKTLILFWTGIIGSFFIIYFLVKKNHRWIKYIYDQKFYIIFIISVLAFSYSHFTLYENNTSIKSILLSPLYLYTYIVAGIIYGLLRIKIGFIWGCLAHIFWNLFVTLNQQ